MADTYLVSCQELALTEVQILATQQENQRLAEALTLKAEKVRGRRERLNQLRDIEARTKMELQHAEDQRTALEAAL